MLSHYLGGFGVGLPYVSVGLASVSIGCGVWSIRRGISSSRQLAKRSDDLAATSKAIYDSLSTRYIGLFPAQLKAITALVKQAKSSIDTLWDAVDPGSYVNTQEHLRLLHALIQKSHDDVKIRYIIWGAPQLISRASRARNETRDELRLHARDFACGVSQKPFLDQVGRLAGQLTSGAAEAAAGITKLLESLSAKALDEKIFEHSDFKDTLKAAQRCYHEWVTDRLIAEGVDVKVYSTGSNGESIEPEYFFWIADRDEPTAEAILLLICPEQDALAFRTRDPNLVQRLGRIFDSKLNIVGNASA